MLRNVGQILKSFPKETSDSVGILIQFNFSVDSIQFVFWVDRKKNGTRKEGEQVGMITFLRQEVAPKLKEIFYFFSRPSKYSFTENL
jgi:hypothetical protein